MPKKDTTKVGEILVILGGIVGLLYGILNVLNVGMILFPGPGLIGYLGNLVIGVIQIVISLIVLATSGVVKIPALKMDKNWVVMLILGIVLYLFGAGLPGVLVIIGAILLAL
ncbi:MAG TPA: hypothetical protein ENG31_01365 [Candidatus Thorarchaeota archaeon]|nr:MAG: hypothetical protein DRO73_03770 [Candidatus Thorarchaeota archaeon]RLI61258.1 MAG: hypothetical protein DRO93_04775 [Candidatus Thorarchaeota archaeon]HDD67255.1 hypothetical protein [Candidatus Thorarchaeota archaeon]